MKLKSERKSSRKRCKPFLILPSITNDSFEKQPDDMTNKNTGLKLFTKTWLPKRDAKVKKPAEYPPRPLTATLEAPTILDISLMGKIDMSKIRKEFLNISNLCRVPLVLKNRKAAKVTRPLSLPPAQKKKKKTSDAEDNWEKTSARKAKNDKINDDIKKSAVVNQTRHNGAIKVNNISDANNNKTRKSVPVSDRTSIVRNDANKSTKLPEPCKTCGRPEQPERFHSHPATPMRQARKMEQSPKAPVKSIVQKPVAIKYKSKTKETEKKPSPNRKPASPPQKMVQTPSNAEQRANSNNNNKAPAVPKQTEPVPRAKSAKRTLTCYLCGREFGTASLPLHEPKCLQRWERENASLPPHLQRKPPPKPDASESKEEWDRLAWEASQSTLTPCHNCGRTFYPDRLIVHQRSCKTPQPQIRTSSDFLSAGNPTPVSNSTPATPTGRRPPSTECYICGKMFGSNSIKIHERQCLKKWNTENDSLPPDMRSPQPTRNNGNIKTPEPQRLGPSSEGEREKEDRPKSAKRPPLFPCYLCGKLFTVSSIYIHEPQCLKMWKIENDKLPPHKRRPQPLKPEVKFTRDGKMDFEATNEANWQSHLSQLVPCKICARTFNPDRVEVHERNCKG